MKRADLGQTRFTFSGRRLLALTLSANLFALAAFGQRTGDVQIPIDITFQSFLPGTLVDWEAKVNHNKVQLKWTTTVEKNSSHFVVERSFNGLNYSDAAVLFAAGNSDKRQNYSFSDKVNTAAEQVVYYRLRMLDLDGKSRFSEVRVIRSAKVEENRLELYPNPAVSQLKVRLVDTWQDASVRLDIYDQYGVLVKSRSTERAAIQETLQVADLKAGYYVLRMSKGHESFVQRFLISK